MSNTRHVNTYMIFTKRGRGVGKLVGPIFEKEIDEIKRAHFSDVKKVHILEETAFASIFIDRYYNHIQEFWMDKLFAYFELNAGWIGPVKGSTAEKCYEGTWFAMFEIWENGERILQINPAIGHNPFHFAKLWLDIEELFIFPLDRGPEYLKTVDGHYIVKDALQKHLATTLIQGMCLQ